MEISGPMASTLHMAYIEKMADMDAAVKYKSIQSWSSHTEKSSELTFGTVKKLPLTASDIGSQINLRV